MAGGRPPKPTVLHVVDGTYRGHRHGERLSAPGTGGVPERPEDLDAYGAECWEKFIEPSVAAGVAESLDTMAVAEACRLYSFYRRSCDAAEDDPTDKLVRCAVVGYWTAFEKVAAKYGLTPADRIKLVKPKSTDGGDPADAHFRDTA